MPQGAPHVTPQDDRPLIQISLHIEKDDLNFVSNALAHFKCGGPSQEKLCDVFFNPSLHQQ